MLVILLVALIVLGPQRLPEVARQAGRALAEFRRITSGFQDELRDALQPVTPPPPEMETPTNAPAPDWELPSHLMGGTTPASNGWRHLGPSDAPPDVTSAE